MPAGHNLGTKKSYHEAVEIVAIDLRKRRGVTRIPDRLALLDLVAREAERRDMTVDTTTARTKDLVLRVSIGERGYEFVVRDSEMHVPNGLMVWVLGPGVGGWSGTKYHETKRISLADRLPRIFDDIEAAQPLYDEYERERRERHERFALEDLQRHERLARARIDAESERKLLDAHARWARARDLRSYVDSLQARVAQLEGQDLVDAAAWVDWIEAYIARIDPANDELRFPQ